jgi:hypothetical protein
LGPTGLKATFEKKLNPTFIFEKFEKKTNKELHQNVQTAPF